LLAQGDKRVEEIASATGFSDVYYFSRTFKRFMGMPPTKYRAQVRAEA
jgi:AraC-like DNA-binding protein